MHPQGTNSITFTPLPLDGTSTFPQLLDRQLSLSPTHTAYIYDDEQGNLVRISFRQHIQNVHKACQLVLQDMKPLIDEGETVVAIYASLDTISYCMLVAAIMRAGLIPFCISPRSAAPGLADLLEKTGAASVYVSADTARKHTLAEALETLGKPLPVFVALTFEEIRWRPSHNGVSDEDLPPLPSYPEASMESTAIILHTSGSTSIFTKPLRFSHKTFLQLAAVPWSGFRDHCGEVMGAHTLSNFHGNGILMGTWPFTCGLTVGVLRPSIKLPATPETALDGIIAIKPDIVLSAPAPIEIWSASEAGLKAMQELKGLSYIGATLNQRIGDSLVAQGVALCSTYGAMESGLVMRFFENHGKDWSYFTVRPEFYPVRIPEDDGTGLYSHVYLASPTYMPCYTNTEVDGKPGCAVHDLLEQHPNNPALHRVYGRKDDQINFSSAAKMNPVPVETQINGNPIVDATLVFGERRTRPGVLIQLKLEHQAALEDEAEKAKLLDALWTTVQEANSTSPTHFQISREMVLLADPKKPFSLSSKLQPRRRLVCEQYQEEIAAAYA